MKHFISIFMIITVVASVPVEKWHKSDDGSSYYIESETKYNWFDAWNECARKNMTLIAIDTFYKHSQIDTLIKKIFPNCPSFWLSGHDNAIDKRYEWAATGNIFTFTNWDAGQPDRLNNNEHCILIWQNTWQWFDLPCSHKLGFICEENVFLKQKERELASLKEIFQNVGSKDCKYNNIIMNINRT